MKLKIRFPGKLLPFRKPPVISNLPTELPKDRNQNGFIVALLILWLVIFIVSLSKCKAQDMQGLKIGDRVPDATMSPILNYPHSSAKISDFKGKLLILDFWATWCSSCVSTFPKMYSLQHEFPDQFQILLVNCRSTRDTEQKIKSFLSQRKAYYHFATVIQDTALERLFPHHTIPHYIWIKDQVVVAITEASEVNEKNIRHMLIGSEANLAEKASIHFDIRKTLFQDSNGGDHGPFIYKSGLIGYMKRMESYSGFHYNDAGMVDRIDVLNNSKIALIKFAFPEFATFGSDRTIINAADPESYSPDSTSNLWKEKNCFSYESIFPPCNREDALALMRFDIRKYFHIDVGSAFQVTDCFVLTTADSSGIVKPAISSQPESNIIEQTGAPVYFHDFSLASIARRLENGYRVPFIDQTGILDRVNIDLPANYRDEKALAESLATQGIRLTKEKRKIAFLVISDKSQP